MLESENDGEPFIGPQTPAVLYFERVDLMQLFDVSLLPVDLDSSVLSQDISLSP